jgi:hypothetical protein
MSLFVAPETGDGVSRHRLVVNRCRPFGLGLPMTVPFTSILLLRIAIQVPILPIIWY